MKIGTFQCWLFGHKFSIRFKQIGVPGFNKVPLGYKQTFYKRSDFCVRCGISKDLTK